VAIRGALPHAIAEHPFGVFCIFRPLVEDSPTRLFSSACGFFRIFHVSSRGYVNVVNDETVDDFYFEHFNALFPLVREGQ
jgi:hypothetical protein